MEPSGIVTTCQMSCMSAGAAHDKEIVLMFDKKENLLMKRGSTILMGERINRIFRLKIEVELEKTIVKKHLPREVRALESGTSEWHTRMLSMSSFFPRIKEFHLHLKIILFVTTFEKMHRLPFSKERTKASVIGEIIHADVCEKMEVESFGGSK